jgi:hypothetical protein
MRAFALTILAALTLVTSLAAGIARGHADPSSRVVLCTGQGPVMVYVDASGQPTAPPELCPDGILALFAAVPAVPSPAPLLLGRMQHLDPLPVRAGASLVIWIDGRARSPPFAA